MVVDLNIQNELSEYKLKKSIIKVWRCSSCRVPSGDCGYCTAWGDNPPRDCLNPHLRFRINEWSAPFWYRVEIH